MNRFIKKVTHDILQQRFHRRSQDNHQAKDHKNILREYNFHLDMSPIPLDKTLYEKTTERLSRIHTLRYKVKGYG